MFEFIKNMWVMSKYTIAQINLCIAKGYITQEQGNGILNTPQI